MHSIRVNYISVVCFPYEMTTKEVYFPYENTMAGKKNFHFP